MIPAKHMPWGWLVKVRKAYRRMKRYLVIIRGERWKGGKVVEARDVFSALKKVPLLPGSRVSVKLLSSTDQRTFV